MGRSEEFDLGHHSESLDLRTGPRPGREGLLPGETDYRGTLQERLSELHAAGRVGVAKGYPPRGGRALSLTDEDRGPYGLITPREQRHLVLHHNIDTHDIKDLTNHSAWHRRQHEQGSFIGEPHFHAHQGHNLGLKGDRDFGTFWDD